MSKAPRPARVYHIQVKTHKMTIMHAGLSPTMKMADVKKETLSALTADVASDALDVMAMDPPAFEVETVNDFELCLAVKDKGKLTGIFEVLDPSKILRESGISGWEAVFLQFRDRETGKLLPITYTLPPMYEDEVEAQAPRTSETENTSKGKRKASVELGDDDVDF